MQSENSTNPVIESQLQLEVLESHAGFYIKISPV